MLGSRIYYNDKGIANNKDFTIFIFYLIKSIKQMSCSIMKPPSSPPSPHQQPPPFVICSNAYYHAKQVFDS